LPDNNFLLQEDYFMILQEDGFGIYIETEIPTPTPTPTQTETPTQTPTNTPTITPTQTSTPTVTPTEPFFLLFEDSSIATAENNDNIEIDII
jgi:hypothetical protein